jgi:hypothetical protein
MNSHFKFRSIVSLAAILALLLPGAAFTQSAKTAEIDAAIRKEGMENSQIMRTLHMLTDVYGPRLTGSPSHVAAANWAAKQMADWGFQNTALEPWDFGHPGWVNERASGFIISPVKDSLVFEVLAWTPGLKKKVTAPVVSFVLPDRPTQEELTAYLNGIQPQVRGKIILYGKPAVVPVNFEPPPKRIAEDVLKRRFDPNSPAPQGPPPGVIPQPTPTPKPNALTGAQVTEQVDAFFVANKAALRINDAGREHGQIRAFNNRTFDVTKVVPTVVMRNEDFGRIYRLLADNMPVTLEFDIQNRTIPQGTTSYNVVGEIVGSERPDEVVMLGGHLDSWHAATGATDNAIGCAIMMEAARILKAIGVKPKRTIRVALWSGEEQGLLGSQAYVKKHFGSFENPTPEYSKFGGYFNIDSGTGRARGFSVFGPPEAATVLREAVSPFGDLGMVGVAATRSRNLGGTDSTSFNNAGLPGIGTQQDPIEYGSHTWHTNLDTYERIVEGDVKAAAIVIAAALYELSMRDQLLPRFPANQMPPPPPVN